ncbi:MAG: hypothetical protein KatS3mg077_1024 [Candidatus Binatia bacterium]|nr:MAG: hypothetical protein KatS3mg077_1024 [Candidatus Binatia bacterium]
MSKKAEVVAAFGLALFGLVFAASVVEVGVRLLHLVPDRFWEADPDTGVRLIPNKRGWWTQEEREFVVPVAINARGLRDVQREYTKPSGHVRILVVGDSFVEAMHVRLEEMFTRRLEHLLDGVGASRRVEVISAGVSGWGTASELLWLGKEGRKYQPDIVLLHFYPGNDIKNNSPILEDTLPPVYSDSGDLLYVRSNKSERHVSGGPLKWSKAYVWIRQRMIMQRPSWAEALERMGVIRLPQPRTPRMTDGFPLDFGVYAVPVDEPWRDAWSRTERLLVAMQNEASAMGARFGIVVAAGREQVYPSSWEQILNTYPAARQRTFDLEQPERWVEEWCAHHGVPCLRLTPVFRAAAVEGPPLHFWHDGHWTKDGHRVAAEEIRKFLLANFPLS